MKWLEGAISSTSTRTLFPILILRASPKYPSEERISRLALRYTWTARIHLDGTRGTLRRFRFKIAVETAKLKK
ncbi:MAG: hypothetical protein A3J58_02810 [Candidatus Sungbacteria bacterium RIFCSPHIGHO2_02_FULL_52_23]|uniref:Uncharacterized protein n=1 Tax=Candidatus Sungbacteria bacterium RIFCSPHIGHO2_02_FULL_52_23 TaxID=1802274 RepID=A0A1G2KTA5_9BACT|nr:MAG: hypothetical protein A3J58_02810 [Candidatus Sungbacteria bacterium RIFCSPHIGHO2_02_FULL_52_23]